MLVKTNDVHKINKAIASKTQKHTHSPMLIGLKKGIFAS